MSSISMERVIDALYRREGAANGSDQPVDNAEFMKSLCEIYGLKHSAYITVDKRSFISRKPKFLVTYPVEWQAEYRKTFAEQKDPVMQAGLSEILPFDWRQVRERMPEADQVLGLAREYSLGKQGLSVPIRGDGGARALFSVTGDYNEKDWRDVKREFLRDFVTLAHFFHKRVSGEADEKAPMLSERERHILQYCAMGLTAVEISVRLDVTVSTVKYHLNQLRYKMNVVNTTHAVATALKLGLITVV
jgi:DNA-binding CsgD family transcriptional regulator